MRSKKSLVRISSACSGVMSFCFAINITFFLWQCYYLKRSKQFGFTFEFLRTHINSYNESINDLINTLTEDENRILEIIKSGRKLTKEEMAQEIGKSKATVQRCIKSLLEKGFIKRIGSNKTGYWVVV